jgi:aspartyl-tRNA(Asn)/glutamyl-tRNA(Gln) amidotransferase subunit A
LRGKRVAVVPSLGGVTLEPGVEEHLRAEAKQLLAATGMVQVDVDVRLPNLAAQWAMGNVATLLADLGDKWPGCASELTDEVAFGLQLSQSMYGLHTAAAAERLRIEANEAMARAFEQVDFIIAATNPGPAFPADQTTSAQQRPIVDRLLSSAAGQYGFRGVMGLVRLAAVFAPSLPSRILGVGSRLVPDMINMGGLTIISNIYGNPAVSVPAGTVGGLPVGMQVLARHYDDALLFDVALAVERERPWPLVAS